MACELGGALGRWWSLGEVAEAATHSLVPPADTVDVAEVVVEVVVEVVAEVVVEVVAEVVVEVVAEDVVEDVVEAQQRTGAVSGRPFFSVVIRVELCTAYDKILPRRAWQ